MYEYKVHRAESTCNLCIRHAHVFVITISSGGSSGAYVQRDKDRSRRGLFFTLTVPIIGNRRRRFIKKVTRGPSWKKNPDVSLSIEGRSLIGEASILDHNGTTMTRLLAAACAKRKKQARCWTDRRNAPCNYRTSRGRNEPSVTSNLAYVDKTTALMSCRGRKKKIR